MDMEKENLPGQLTGVPGWPQSYGSKAFYPKSSFVPVKTICSIFVSLLPTSSCEITPGFLTSHHAKKSEV
jgi:hypothetical protein